MNKFDSLNISSLVISSHLNKSIELLGDSDHHVVVDKVPLGRGQGPLAAGLPALGCRAAEEGNLHQDIKFLVSSLHFIATWSHIRLGSQSWDSWSATHSSKVVVSPSLARTLSTSTSSP